MLDILIGIEFLDADHDAILNMMDSLDTSTNLSERDYAAAMMRILDYCSHHFRTEEAFMRKIGYPATEFHCGKHREISQVVKANLMNTVNKKTSRMECISLCKTIICEHVTTHDIPLSQFYHDIPTLSPFDSQWHNTTCQL